MSLLSDLDKSLRAAVASAVGTEKKALYDVETFVKGVEAQVTPASIQAAAGELSTPAAATAGLPFAELPLDLADLTLFTVGRTYTLQGFELYFRCKDSHPGVILEVQSSGLLTLLRPGQRIRFPFSQLTIRVRQGIVPFPATAYANLVISTDAGVTYREEVGTLSCQKGVPLLPQAQYLSSFTGSVTPGTAGAFPGVKVTGFKKAAFSFINFGTPSTGNIIVLPFFCFGNVANDGVTIGSQQTSWTTWPDAVKTFIGSYLGATNLNPCFAAFDLSTLPEPEPAKSSAWTDLFLNFSFFSTGTSIATYGLAGYPAPSPGVTSPAFAVGYA